METHDEFYNSKWFIVLCYFSIVLIPLGIFLTCKKENLNKYYKISISLVSGVVFLSIPWFVVHNISGNASNINRNSIDNSSGYVDYKAALEDVKESSIPEYNSSSKPAISGFSSRSKENDEGDFVLEDTKKSENKKSKKNSKEKVEHNTSTEKSSSDTLTSKSENTEVTKESCKNNSSESKEENKSKSNNVVKVEKESKEVNEKPATKSNIVYVTPKGKRYHSKNPCGKGEFSAINLDDAINKGYTPCKRCVK